MYSCVRWRQWCAHFHAFFFYVYFVWMTPLVQVHSRNLNAHYILSFITAGDLKEKHQNNKKHLHLRLDDVLYQAPLQHQL